MVNDCLVTKLKGTVDNPNLPYIGEFDLDVLIKENSVQTVRDISMQSPSTIYWKSDKDVYDKVGTDPSRVNLGRSGSFTGIKRLWCTETTRFKLYPMYDMVKCAPHTKYMGQVDVDKLKLSNSIFNCEGHRGQTLYGHLDEIAFDLNITDDGFGVQLPLSLNMKYDKVIVPTTSPCAMDWSIYTSDRYPFIDKFFMDNVETGADICGILNGTNIASQLSSITLPCDNKVSVSNIEDFNYQNCPNLVAFTLHKVTSMGGNFVNAFKDNPNLTTIAIVLSVGSSPIELKPLFDGWKAAGKKNSTCAFYMNIGDWTINGEDPVTVSGSKNVVFDANGDWTIQ